MTNPLVKKGTPTFPKNDNKEHEQLEHPVIKNEIPEVNTGTNVNTSTNLLNQFYEEPKKIVKKQVSIYLDKDVIDALESWVDTLPEKKKKGARSDLVNNFLMQVFNIRQDKNN